MAKRESKTSSMEKGNCASYEEMSQSTEMEYLKKKWSVWFQTLDGDHDGVISTKDRDISTKKFAEIRKKLESGDKSGDKRPENVKFDIEKWWNDYIFRKLKGPEVKMTNDEFVNSLAEAYQKDNAAFREEMERCFEDIANFLTPDMQRNITENEFADGFKAFKFGQVDEEKINDAYKLFKAAHEQLTVQLLVDAWVQFTADVDQSKQDIIMEIYGN
nr:sarcoplasmic calcium-binding protein isoform X2 [Crassostrea gigas]